MTEPTPERDTGRQPKPERETGREPKPERETGRQPKPERVVVAMSGGVDSSVAAWLLRERGHDLVGLFLRNGVSRAGTSLRPGRQGCCSVEDARDARRVADRLQIPFYALDYEQGFDRLIERFVDDYARGRTPSPCVLCNTWLKFGQLVSFARSVDAAAVATGHYARLARSAAGRLELRRARDEAKDQTYFLAHLSQEQLERARFPLGELTKPEVRELARRAGLPVAEKAESMEICFVPDGDYRSLVVARRPDALRPGPIVLPGGERVGTHGGHAGFTIGQRRGLGVALGEPAYVTRINAARNEVTIGPREALRRESLAASEVCWISRAAPAIGSAVRCRARIRHRAPDQPATTTRTGPATIRVDFDRPVYAVAPGQALALYAEDEPDLVLGGGWID